jgi:hypothetical protein
MVGPGRYDDICSAVRELAGAECVMLIVMGGKRGPGFSVQMVDDPTIMLRLPNVLEHIAGEIRADIERIRHNGVRKQA